MNSTRKLFLSLTNISVLLNPRTYKGVGVEGVGQGACHPHKVFLRFLPEDQHLTFAVALLSSFAQILS